MSSLRCEVGFALWFLLLFAGLQYAYSQSRGTALEHFIIDIATVRPSAFLINLLAPGEHVRAVGHSLISPWARLNVLNGCEGVGSILLVVSALLACRLPWAARLRGAAAAVALLYAINQARIIALYFSARLDHRLFVLIHGYIGPTLIIALAMLFFLWWVSRRREAET